MTRSTICAVFSLLAVSSPVLAQQATSAQRAACTPDVLRLCASHIPDAAAIKSCLRSERPRLSIACRTVLDEAASPKVATRSIAMVP